jgi:ATP-binding cassette, subfamily B, bacterial
MMLSNLFKEIGKVRTQAPYLLQAFRLVWTAARPWTMAWSLLLVVQGTLPIGIVYLTRSLVDNLASVLGSGLDLTDLRPTILLVVAMAILLLLTESLNGVARWVRTAQADLVQDHISFLIQQKATTLDLSFFESADSYDKMHRAKYDAATRPLILLENTGGLVQNGITLIAMAAVLISYAPWLPLLLVASTVPALSVVLHFAARHHEWWLKNTRLDRRSRYYDWIITIRESAAEIRLFDLGEHFRSAYQVIRSQLRGERLKMSKDQAFAEWGASLAGVLVLGISMGWMVWRAVQGQATLGDLAMFHQAFQQGQRMMRTLLDNVGQIYQNGLFLELLFEFLGLKPVLLDTGESAATPTGINDGVRFEGVTFRYPGSERVALEDFSLFIPAGKITAIVGTNGAGKSTLIKLLCRFYDPESGKVLLDGTDMRNLSPTQVQSMISVLFQEPVHYHDTAAENIAIGYTQRRPDMDEIVAAAESGGAAAPINRLPEGYDTMLGKWFGGSDLSTGEWQRVALARAFLRRTPLIILDEPTSAMDAWAEAEWMNRFRDLTSSQTALIITHRFTTAMQADIIHVMDAGCIQESGTHDDLIKQGGRYASSWKDQYGRVLD